jgi:hypothetical protein
MKPDLSTTWVSAAVAVAAIAGGALSASTTVQSPKPKPIWARNHPLPGGFNPGEAFPTIALPSAVDGRPISLADFRGKKVIVNIFASW